MALARLGIETTNVRIEQAERHPPPSYMRRAIAIRLVETPGPYAARSIAPPGWEQAVLACPRARKHQPTTLLKFHNPAHDRGAIRLTIAPHPGGQVACGEWHGIFRCHGKPSNRCVDANCEGIMSRGENEAIWNQDIAVGVLCFPATMCTWRSKLT